MYIEFIAGVANGKLSARKKRLVATLICFVIAMLSLIAYSAHLALSLLIPIFLVCYQLRSVFKSRNSIRDVKMRFEFNDEYLIWSQYDGEELTKKKINYDNTDLIIDDEGRCEILYTNKKNKKCIDVFYGPQKELEEIRDVIHQKTN